MEEYTVKVYKYKTEWYQNKKLHRLNGPAIEWHNGDKAYYENGKRHRIDGPALEWTDGYKEWWIEGKEYYTEEEFNKKINPVVELTVNEISKRLGFTVKVVGEK